VPTEALCFQAVSACTAHSHRKPYQSTHKRTAAIQFLVHTTWDSCIHAYSLLYMSSETPNGYWPPTGTNIPFRIPIIHAELLDLPVAGWQAVLNISTKEQINAKSPFVTFNTLFYTSLHWKHEQRSLQIPSNIVTVAFPVAYIWPMCFTHVMLSIKVQGNHLKYLPDSRRTQFTTICVNRVWSFKVDDNAHRAFMVWLRL